MPLPYLGSKRRSAGKIYQAIKNINPDAKILVDLFCGGLAVSEYFYKNGWKIIANDKNKYVIEVIKKAIDGGFNDNVFTPEFITREMFIDTINNPDNYDGWYVGYLMCIWTFGNNQSGYLFGKDTEPYKQAGHELVVNKNQDLIKKLIPNIPQKYLDGLMSLDNWHKRRIALVKISRKLKTRVLELQRLEQLEQLQRLERLQQLQQLEFYSDDYKNIEIPKDSIIYCDPPYQNTAEYREGNFNHEEFWSWVRAKSKTNEVYISEYKAPDDFIKVLEFQQNSTYAGGNNKLQPNECLFTISEKL